METKRFARNQIYLSVDGGGTKLQMLLYDQSLTLLGEGFAGGVNTNSTTPEDSLKNVKLCLEQVFATYRPAEIERVYTVFVGPSKNLDQELAHYAKVREFIPVQEPDAGLMSGAFWRDGILALSGTGSDIFLRPGAQKLRVLAGYERGMTVGGWGPLLGDQGSGVWVGQQAIRAAISGLEGWTKPTLLLDLIRREWHVRDDWDMVPIVYGSPSPIRKMASLTPLVGEAANEEDEVALSILREAGELLAAQALCLFRRYDIPPELRRMVCAGGTWKCHARMFETFRDRLLDEYPDLDIRMPRFEPILAGPALLALEGGATVGEAAALLAQRFPQMKISCPWGCKGEP